VIVQDLGGGQIEVAAINPTMSIAVPTSHGRDINVVETQQTMSDST